MKKKVLTAFACVAVVATTLLTSCNAGNQHLQLNPNWLYNTSATAELSDDNAINEVLTYEVSFEATNGLISGKYDVKYCVDVDGNAAPGTYTMTTTSNGGIYTLTSNLSLPIAYTYGGETFAEVQSMASTVSFKKTGEKLQPISSTKTVHCYTPLNVTPSKLSDCYKEYKYELTINYNDSCNGSESVVFKDYRGTWLGGTATDTEPKIKDDYSFGIDKSKHTYLDNEQLYFALRGLSNDVMRGTSYVNVYNHAKLAVKNVVVKGVEQGTTKDFAFLAENVPYNTVSVALNETNSGNAIQLTYAKTTSASENAYRNALLRIKETLPYGMGSLNYKLTSKAW